MAIQALAVGVAGYKIISGFMQADMVGRQMELQKLIDEENAKLAEYDAWKTQAYGQTLVAEYQQQVDQAQAKARVSAAAQGVSTTEGSTAELIQQNEMVGLANQLNIEAQTREKALGYTRQARNIRTGSAINQATGKAQQSSIITGSLASAGGTIAAGMIDSKSSTGNTIKEKSTSVKTGMESGYSVPTLSLSPRSYLTGTSQDTGYLGLP